MWYWPRKGPGTPQGAAHSAPLLSSGPIPSPSQPPEAPNQELVLLGQPNLKVHPALKGVGKNLKNVDPPKAALGSSQCGGEGASEQNLAVCRGARGWALADRSLVRPPPLSWVGGKEPPPLLHSQAALIWPAASPASQHNSPVCNV